MIVFNPNRVPYSVIKKNEDTKIPFKLVDERGAFSTHTLKVMAKQYIPPPKPFIPVYEPLKIKPKPKPPKPPVIEPPTPAYALPLRVNVEDISTLGQVQIKFNQEFKFVDESDHKRMLQETKNFTDFNKYFEPIIELGEYEKDSSFNKSKFDFNWEITNFDPV